MARRVICGFHYSPDNWRPSWVRNSGVIEGNRPAADSDWESITRGGDKAVKRWIADQLSGRSCTVVLVGTNTARRKWINYESIKPWDDGKGVVDIHVYGLQSRDESISRKGVNLFDDFG